MLGLGYVIVFYLSGVDGTFAQASAAGAMLAERVGPLPAEWTGTSAWASRCGRQIIRSR
jgi:hypothetical protein